MASLKLNKYDRATIVEWYDKGMYSQRELAEIYNVSRSTVRRVIEDDRNFCGRTDRPTFPLGRPTIEDVGQPNDYALGLDDTSYVSEPYWDGPPAWLGVGLLAIAVSGAGFIAWVILNAAA